MGQVIGNRVRLAERLPHKSRLANSEECAIKITSPRSEWLWATWKKFWVAIVLSLVATFSAFTTSSLHGQELSPIDEWVYVDYLFKLPEQIIVRQGELIGEQARQVMACSGSVPFGLQGPPCESELNPDEFPWKSITTVDKYTPLYFWSTWIIGKPFQWLGADEITSWRWASSLWLTAGLVMFVAQLNFWRVPKIVTMALGLALIASPFSYWTFTYVSTDAPLFFFGAWLLYLASLFSQGERPGWLLIPVAVVMVLFKVTALLGVLLVGLFLVAEFIRDSLSTKRFSLADFRPGTPAVRRYQLLVFPLLAGIAAGVSQLLWLQTSSMFVASDASVDQGISIPLTPLGMAQLAFYFLPGIIQTGVLVTPGSFVDMIPMPSVFAIPLAWLLISGVAGSFFLVRRASARRSMVDGVLISALISGPLLALLILGTTGSYFQLPSRYAAAMLPGFLLVTSNILRNKAAIVLLICFSAALILSQPFASALIANR